MKKLIIFFSVVLFVINIFAQVPQKMSYQAVIRDINNVLVTNTTIGIRISVLQGASSGTAVYIETQKPTTNENGLASFEIGTGTIVSGKFSTIDWANGPLYVKTEIDPTGSGNYSIAGTSQLLSVPYAIYAKTAEYSANGGSSGNVHSIGEVFGGGVIFHIWKDASGVEHGLIVAQTDQSQSQVWSNNTLSLVGGMAQSSWSGMENSDAIIKQGGHTSSAASVARAYAGGSNTDWYLPSLDELNLLYQNRFNVNKTLSVTSGATQIGQNFYWSSTENINTDAWCLSFDIGDAYSISKYNTIYVRAVRYF